MTQPQQQTTPPPIPYELWTPALAKISIEEPITDILGRKFITIRQGTEFDRFVQNEVYHRTYTDERGKHYEQTITGKLKPEGHISLTGNFYRDGSMYAKKAQVTLWEEAGIHLPEFTPLHAAAIEICHRLNLSFSTNDAYAYIKEHHNLQEVINTLTTLKTFHRQMHLLYQTEGKRLANLAERLDQDLYQQK